MKLSFNHTHAAPSSYFLPFLDDDDDDGKPTSNSTFSLYRSNAAKDLPIANFVSLLQKTTTTMIWAASWSKPRIHVSWIIYESVEERSRRKKLSWRESLKKCQSFFVKPTCKLAHTTWADPLRPRFKFKTQCWLAMLMTFFSASATIDRRPSRRMCEKCNNA